MRGKINGRNAVPEKIASSCLLVIVEPVPNVKRVNDWALDVAQFLLLLNTTRMLEKERLSCMYIQLSRKIDREGLIFAVPRSFQTIRKSRNKIKRRTYFAIGSNVVYIVVNVFLIMYRFKIICMSIKFPGRPVLKPFLELRNARAQWLENKKKRKKKKYKTMSSNIKVTS